MKWSPPFNFVPMPVDKDGHGPANCQEAVRTLYEIWDAGYVTVCECSSPEDAQALVDILNKEVT